MATPDELAADYEAGHEVQQHELDRALDAMTSPAFDWEMTSPGGNGACGEALARLLDRVDVLAADQLASAAGQLMIEVIEAGHYDITDTEPETHVETAANLIAATRGWPPVSRFEFVEHYGPTWDRKRRSEAEARDAATQRLRKYHSDDFGRFLAEERDLRDLPPRRNGT